MRVIVHVFMALASMVGLFAVGAFVGEHGEPWYRVVAMFAIVWGLFCIWACVYPDVKKLVDAIKGLK